MGNKRSKSVTCQYSDSCFTCPRSDCIMEDKTAYRLNRMPMDFEFDYKRTKRKNEQKKW